MTISVQKSVQKNRRQLFAVAIAAAAYASIPTLLLATPRSPKVLFICQFGTAKSAIARELFKRRAAQRGIAVSVSSRGITPELHLSPVTQKTLQAEGIELNLDRVRKLEKADLKAADIIVVFNPLPAPLRIKKLIDWSSLPSVNDSYIAARVDLDRRINALLDSIVRSNR